MNQKFYNLPNINLYDISNDNLEKILIYESYQKIIYVYQILKVEYY